MTKTTDIILKVALDDEQVPERIFWKAEGQQEEWIQAKAFLLSIFEEDSKDTLKLDLWTKEFQMNEMDRLMFHTLQSLCETYRKATNNQELAQAFRGFVNHFGEKTEIIPPTSG
ncbi:MAG TPA: gliding motility protein GldC [Saprospiraceae bacterium]|nr:gliding motility protein GldC [Saprospiraceae bacterium]